MMEGKSKDKETLDLISKIAPLAGLLAAAITVFSDLPIFVRHIIVALLALITVLSIYAVFAQPLIKVIKKKAMAKKHRILTEKYYEKFKTLVERFRERMSEDRRDAMLGILRRLANHSPKYVNVLPDSQRFTEAIDTCHKAVGKLSITKDSFLILVGWFESIVALCNDHLIRKAVEEIRRIGQDGIPEHIREEYERCKTIYDRLLDDYTDFAKDMNKQFGQTVARDYFEVPKGLTK